MALVWALCFGLAFFHSAVAREFVVGGRKGWVVPSGGEPETYQQWSSRNRFLTGDTLLFKYNPAEDSVVQVTAHHYDACNKSSPIASYKGGNTVFRLPRHGPFYFISGNRSNCQKGEKLTVVVIAPRNRSHGAPPPTAASPGPSVVAPSSSIPAPTTKSPSSSPSPAPSPVVSAPSPSPTPVGAAPSPSSSSAPLVAVPYPSSSPSPVSPTLSPPSPLTATPSSSTPSSLPSPSTATPSSSSPTTPANASPPALVTALNLVIPLLVALKILTIY